MNILKSLNNQYYKKIFFPNYKSNWVLGNEYKELKKISKKINLNSTYVPYKQYCYIPDKYYAINRNLFHLLGNRVIFDYFHGNPSLSSDFLKIYKNLRKKINNFYKIRVSNTGMLNFFLNDGLDNNLFKLIHIGININSFPRRNIEDKELMRAKYMIPKESFVLGSFQKDGNGWGEGNTPKLIKGPDIFLNTIKFLKSRISNLFVLLTGPSRGYVKSNLEKMGINYKHIYLDDYKKIYELYHILDYYVIASREEGGPKALLESMATGVPIVSTNVGQAIDLLKNNINGFKSITFDPEEIGNLLLNNANPNEELINNARITAEQNDYNEQLDSWKSIFPHL
jgi:glycosyltransferase involved in cell wall biosynthesis